jgi:hypothetical protein
MRLKLFYLIVLSFLLLHVNYIVAQQQYASITSRIRNPKDVYGVADSAGNLAYIFEGHKQYHVAILNKDSAQEKNFIINRVTRGKKEAIIGAVLNQGRSTSYFYSKKFGSFSSLTIDRATGEYKFYEIKQMSANEQFLRAFTMNEKFYILTVPRQKNVLNVYICEDGEHIDAGSYAIEMPAFYSNLIASNDLLNEPAESQAGIETVRTRLDNNIKSAYPKKKLYYERDKIYMSFDDPGSTHLIIIDLNASKSYYKKLNFALDQGNNSSHKRGNSFLYDDKIFRATISPEMMNISVIDLDSISLINSFNIFPEDEEIPIANGPIVQEGGYANLPTEERVLNKTKQYFRRVLNGNLSIAANRIDSGRVEVEVGSYEEILIRNNGFNTPGFSTGMGMGFGMSMGMGMGMGMGYPYFGSPFGYGSGFYPGYYPYNSYGSMRLRIVSFKTLLKDPLYNHVGGTVPKTLREKINEYIQHTFKHGSPNLYSITSLNEEKLLMGYYLKSKNKFEVISFDKLGGDDTNY